jgi:hypothetical protein
MSEFRHLTISREKEGEKYDCRDWGHPTSVFFKKIFGESINVGLLKT